jgi:hypothetical protein
MVRQKGDMLRRNLSILVWVILAVLPWVAYAADPPVGVGQSVSVGELGSISWPAAVAWVAYLLKQWEPRVHVVHERGD